MSRRTFPRAAAAGLVAATIGTPVSGQAPNPWRGETAALPTAPAPRAVGTPHTRQIVLGVGYNQFGGLTGTMHYRTLTPVPAVQVTSAPRVTTTARPVSVDLDIVAGPCPCPAQFTAQTVATPGISEITFHVGEPVVINSLKPLVAATYIPVVSSSPLKPVATNSPTNAPTAQRASYVIPAGYSAPVIVTPPQYMPPPAPLPVTLPAPRPIPPAQLDVLVPVQFEIAFPEKGVRPVWTPSSNAVPPGQLRLLDTIRLTATPAAQGRQ